MLKSISLAALLFAPLAATAHHGMTLYDRNSTIELEGVVTQLEWRNPHVYVYVEVASDTGERTVWEVEGQPPTILKRQGWSEDSVAVGDRVSISAFPSRDSNRNIAGGRVLRKADGTEFAIGFEPALLLSADPAATRAQGLAGTWSPLINPPVTMGLIVGPVARPDLARQAPRMPWPLTEKASAAVAGFVQESMLPGIECIPYTSPFLMVLPDVKTIEIADDAVRIRSDFEDVERTVDLRATSHDGAPVSLQGHSIGRWEGDVLVIDTARFADHRVGNAMGLPSGAGKHLVERLRLNPDGTSLTYAFELEDPEYLTAPVTGAVQWSYQPEATYSPTECDRDNARRFFTD